MTRSRSAARCFVSKRSSPPEPQREDTFGAGNLPELFEAAAGQWERAIADDLTVTINYTWAFIGSGTLGIGLPATTGARPTGGFINLNNRDTPWFFDATPDDDAEFGGFVEDSLFLGGSDGNINVGRQYNTATGDAASAFDLFSVMLHEIGHVLALGTISNPFAEEIIDGDVDLTSPLPFAGAAIPTTELGGGHINLPSALMNPFTGIGERSLLTEVDILTVAQINGYTQIDLDPARVPEPGVLVLWMTAGVALMRSGRPG